MASIIFASVVAAGLLLVLLACIVNLWFAIAVERKRENARYICRVTGEAWERANRGR